jgi:hypothetical protein
MNARGRDWKGMKIACERERRGSERERSVKTEIGTERKF